MVMKPLHKFILHPSTNKFLQTELEFEKNAKSDFILQKKNYNQSLSLFWNLECHKHNWG